eukprot:UN02644
MEMNTVDFNTIETVSFIELLLIIENIVFQPNHVHI